MERTETHAHEADFWHLCRLSGIAIAVTLLAMSVLG